MEIFVPKEFPLVLLACALICAECVVIGVISAIGARSTHFTEQFMQQFQAEHQKAFPETKAATLGHPDAGDGRYSEKLPYKSWVEFNNSMSVHQNFVEYLPVILALILIGGLIYPKCAVAVGFNFALCRGIYTVMYMKLGSDARYIGAIGGTGPVFALGLSSFVSLVFQYLI